MAFEQVNYKGGTQLGMYCFSENRKKWVILSLNDLLEASPCFLQCARCNKTLIYVLYLLSVTWLIYHTTVNAFFMGMAK